MLYPLPAESVFRDKAALVRLQAQIYEDPAEDRQEERDQVLGGGAAGGSRAATQVGSVQTWQGGWGSGVPAAHGWGALSLVLVFLRLSVAEN